jgi:hypothetical protein
MLKVLLTILAGALTVAESARADVIHVLDDNGVISIADPGSSRFVTGLLNGPSLNAALTNQGVFTNPTLWGDPIDLFLEDAVQLRYDDNSGSINPSAIEFLIAPNVELSPHTCADLSEDDPFHIGCRPTVSGKIYDAAQLDWSDGTVDIVTFEWIVAVAGAPDPSSIVLLATVIAAAFGLTLWRTRLHPSASTF